MNFIKQTFVYVIAFISAVVPIRKLQPTSSPKVELQAENTLSPTMIWKFSNNQYEVFVNNITYSGGPFGMSEYGASFDLSFKNISVSPMIIYYQIADCLVTKNGNPTRFTAATSYTFPKGLLPGESTQIKAVIGIYGEDYDSSGNKVSPTSDLRIKTCILQPKTPDEKLGLPLHPVVGSPPKQANLIEPKTIILSN